MLTSVGCGDNNTSSSETDSESAVTTTLEGEDETTLYEDNNDSEATTNTDFGDANVLVYQNENINIYYMRCEEDNYNNQSVVFYVENNYETSVAIFASSLAFDKQNIDIGWNETVAACSAGELSLPVKTDDSLPTLTPSILTMEGRLLDSNWDEIIDFNIVDLPIGTSTDIELGTNKLESDVLLFRSDNISIYYRSCEKDDNNDENVVFYVINNYDTGISMMATSLALDGVNVDVGWNETIAAHSEGELRLPVDDGNELPTYTPLRITIDARLLDSSWESVKEFSIINQSLQETTLDDIEEDSTTQQETEYFIAQGNTTLYNFLDAVSSNGYHLYNPQRDDVYVNAVAKGTGGSFNICYMVEEQHVYMVEVFADDLMSDGFKDCVRAMALTLNPNISDDGLEEAINYVLDSTDESYVIEDTLFRFDSADNKLVITY